MPKIVDKEEKKLVILHAAMLVFARNGIVNTKMIDIANEAGVGKGTIYEYFRSKEDIFMTAFQYVFNTAKQNINHALEATSDPVKKLESLLEITFNSFMGDGGDFAAILMDFWAEGVRNKDSKVLEIVDLKKVYSEYRILISAILNEGIEKGIFRELDVDLISSAFLGTLDGLALQWILDRDAIDINKATSVMLESFLYGIKS